MTRGILLTGVVAFGVAGVAAPASAQDAELAKPLEVGAMAPDFELPAATREGVLGAPVKLSDYRGKVVVMAFFPRARTRGCTIQMHAYRDQYADLFNGGQDVVLLAISADEAETLHAWARDDGFPFTMASDVGAVLAAKYGAISRPGATTTNRNLFVVGKDGRIAYRATPFREIDATAYTELGAAIDKLVAEPEAGR